jgi:predicted flap endonuclease-1-like 5' DNA nuclease/chromosome segregation ATPase
MNWQNILDALDKQESFLAIILLVVAFILGMIFIWIWLGGRIKDARKELEKEQLKNSGLMGKNGELENESKIHLADVNRIRIENREMVNEHEGLIQEKDQLYSQVIMFNESEGALKDELNDVNSRYTIMEASHQKMSSSLTKLSSDFEISIAQKDALHSRVAELEATNQDLMEARIRENASYRTQLGSLQETLNHLQAEYTIAENDFKSKTEELDSFKSKYLSLKNKYDAQLSSNEEVDGFKVAAANSASKDKEIAKVYNAQILSLQEALESATNSLATLEAEKANTTEELEKLKATANQQNDNQLVSSSASFDDNDEISLAVELNVVKKELKAEHQARIEQQQEADRWRASLITLKANLGQAEEDRAREQEKYLNEIAELKGNNKETPELEKQLLNANIKVEELEAKVTWLEAITNDAENDAIHLETSQSNLLDIENDKLSTARDENMELQSQVNSLLSKIRELQGSSDDVDLMGVSVKEELIEDLEDQAIALGASANEASNEIETLEAEHTQVIAAAKEQIDALNLQIDRAEEKVAQLEAKLNEAENDSIELEEKYLKILDVENDKFSAAKDNILSLETQIGLLEAKNIRLAATTNEAENDYIEYEAKFERLLDIEQEKLSAVRDANMSLLEELAEMKIKAAGSVPIINGTSPVQNSTSTTVSDVDTNTRTDANVQEEGIDSNQAKKVLKQLIGNEIPATANQKDNLQEITGIGPRIQEELNKLGINSYQQISTLTTAHLQLIRTALDIFPGKIERDDWVGQGKSLYKDNDELTPETAKLAVQKLLGGKIPWATAKDKDDLKLIKGVGGFLEKQLNSVGIYTFEQISKFDNDAIEKITIAIGFFPERIKRDKWVKQAKGLM